MTIDMAFECLLVSKDARVVTVMDRLLADLAISTTVCPSVSRALGHLGYGSTDLLILDWQKESPELLEYVKQASQYHKPVVVVVSEEQTPGEVTGICSCLRKPINPAYGAQGLKQAYSKLLLEYRRYTRYALQRSVIATNQDGYSLSLTVTNIGKGGIGVAMRGFLKRGDVLSFPLLLPGTDLPIKVRARVLWSRDYGAAGCEFTTLSDADYWSLHDWLEQRCQIKKPLAKS